MGFLVGSFRKTLSIREDFRGVCLGRVLRSQLGMKNDEMSWDLVKISE